MPNSKKIPMELHETVLGDILNLHMELNTICDNKANFLLGISGVILLITLTKFSTEAKAAFDLMQVGFVAITITALATAILAVMVLRPIVSKKARKLNLFYYGCFLEKVSREEYVKKIHDLLKDNNKFEREYAEEIYDFAYHDLFPRFKRVKLATEVLLIGLAFGTILILSSLFI